MLRKLKDNFYTKLLMAYIMLHSATASAISKVDLATDMSKGKTMTDVFTNADNTAQEGAAFFIGLVAIAGYVVIALSLWTLYKASKDEREKPTSAFVGMFVGGLMAGVGTFMWIIRNSMLG